MSDGVIDSESGESMVIGAWKSKSETERLERHWQRETGSWEGEAYQKE